MHVAFGPYLSSDECNCGVFDGDYVQVKTFASPGEPPCNCLGSNADSDISYNGDIFCDEAQEEPTATTFTWQWSIAMDTFPPDDPDVTCCWLFVDLTMDTGILTGTQYRVKLRCTGR